MGKKQYCEAYEGDQWYVVESKQWSTKQAKKKSNKQINKNRTKKAAVPLSKNK